MRECWDLPPDESLFGHNPDWFLHSLRNLFEIQRAMLMMTLWRVWYNHNELTHQKKPAPVESSKRFLQSYLESLLVIKQNEVVNVEKGKQVASYGQGFRKEKHQGDGRQKVKQKWMPPEVGTVKLNVDGTFDQDGHAGAGMILRDEKGEVIIAACRRLQNCSDALEAELAAMEEGIDLALHWSSGDITLESDCMMAIKLTGDQMVNASRHAMRINVIRERFKERKVAVKKISREANGASHGLAQLGRVHGRTAVWLRGFPSEIASAITLDCTHLNF
jgi:ribonuclease HI